MMIMIMLSLPCLLRTNYLFTSVGVNIDTMAKEAQALDINGQLSNITEAENEINLSTWKAIKASPKMGITSNSQTIR